MVRSKIYNICILPYQKFNPYSITDDLSKPRPDALILATQDGTWHDETMTAYLFMLKYWWIALIVVVIIFFLVIFCSSYFHIQNKKKNNNNNTSSLSSSIQREFLRSLNLSDTNVSDVSPLSGMPLQTLNLSFTNVSDVSPLSDNMNIKIYK